MTEPISQKKQPSFKGLGITPPILDVIETLGFSVPTPIQEQAIPVLIHGQDVFGIAQTGTGKTLGFGVPMIQKLLAGPGRALILVPTRELALQVDEVMRKIGNPFDIRSVIVIGGMDLSMQVRLFQKPSIRVIIATPGRFLEHMEKKTTDPSDIHTVVLDEADRMLDMGFAPQIQRLMPFLPKDRQTMLFSATMPDAVVKLAASYTQHPARIQVAASGAAPEKIIQELFIIHPEFKLQLLAKILNQHRGSVLIFTRTKASTWKLKRSLEQMNFTVNELHSDRTAGERRHALKGFKEGLYRVLVATDIAARGLDVHGIGLVINFDLPDETENYVHRIGRTGRAGRAGRAITFAAPDQGEEVRAIESLMKTNLKVIHHPEIKSQAFTRQNAKEKRNHVYENQARHLSGRPNYASEAIKNAPGNPAKNKKSLKGK